MTRALYWFRDDLRLADNVGLREACNDSDAILFVASQDHPARTGASRLWRLRNLDELDRDLRRRGHRLIDLPGDPVTGLADICREHEIDTIHMSGGVDPADRIVEGLIERQLGGRVRIRIHRVGSIIDPESVMTAKGTPFKVFTPFWNAVNEMFLRRVVAAGEVVLPKALGRPDRGMRPRYRPRMTWERELSAHAVAGEDAAADLLAEFINDGLETYSDDRDRFDLDATSGLSAALAVGTISPARVVTEVRDHPAATPYLRQLAWREFARYTLWHNPDMVGEPLNSRFAGFPWREDPESAEAWRRGRTGYPVVDAAMNCLWQTGCLHNRLRMVVGSFLTKHLLLDWRVGRDWFAETLTDFDPANNIFGWQWIAGCGADAAPYFRIFNPVTQGQRFDPDRRFISRYLVRDELFPIDPDHEPVAPIVDHRLARERALEAYRSTSLQEMV